MITEEIKAKSVLRKHKRIDGWFISRYGMNLYRGCEHNCTYCDGRTETYYVQAKFGEKVAVKVNALDILSEELNPARKRKPLTPGFFMLGGGVGDSYQQAEKKYELTRSVLKLFLEKQLPVHILTKSTLVGRDLDIIKELNKISRAIISFSFSSTNTKISRIFEPKASPPIERLRIIEQLKQKGIPTGVYLLPVLPYITDARQIISKSINDFKNAGADYVIFGGLTLKAGKQEAYFYENLEKYDSKLPEQYRKIYKGSPHGNASDSYYQSINNTWLEIIQKSKIPKRIPPSIYNDILPLNDVVTLILNHLDYLYKLNNKPSPFGYASYTISNLNRPLTEIRNHLYQLKGVGKFTEKIINEILDTGSSRYFEKLLLH